MENEKRILRIILDYCHMRRTELFSYEFALTVCPSINKEIIDNTLTFSRFKSICKKRNDFFVANELNINEFCLRLYKHLKHELSYFVFDSFLDSLKEYKRRLENGNARGFPKGTSEDTLRSNLSTYIKYENFCEPRCGFGQCDIIVPQQKCIIETKLWKGIEYYNSGLPELAAYVKTQKYSQGYYVVYDYNVNDNEIIQCNGECFSLIYEGIKIEVIFIRMKKVPPSKIYKSNKKAKESVK